MYKSSSSGLLFSLGVIWYPITCIFLQKVYCQKSIQSDQSPATLTMTHRRYVSSLVGNAENDSAVCTERKVNLLRQFAETDHVSQPTTVLTLMAPIIAALTHVLRSHYLCCGCFQSFYLLYQYSPSTQHWHALLLSAPRKRNHYKINT